MDEAGLALARRLKLEREARGWSLAGLAERAGVSKAAISKIERGETSPTATVLVRLAGAFDLTLAGLFLRAEQGVGDRLVRADAQPLWRDPKTGYVRRQVFMRPEHPLEIAEIELPPRRRVTMPASSYAHIRQAVRVLSGRLLIVEGGQRHELGPGDCLGFGPPAATRFVNEGSKACTYLVVLART
nr:XRE family transcriptional regulator [Solimonas soli]